MNRTRERQLESLLYAIFLKYPDGIEVSRVVLDMYRPGDLLLEATENFQRGTLIAFNARNKVQPKTD